MNAAVPLLCLPGMACTDLAWRPVLDRLPSSMRVRVVQPTGATVEALVDDVLAADADRFDLAGLSLGGIVAMRLAVRAPERVRRLVLLSTNPRPPTPEQRAAWARLRQRVACGDVGSAGLDALRPPAAGPAIDEDVLLQMVLATGPDRFDAQLVAQASRQDLRPSLRSLRLPTLVLHGARDHLCSAQMHREIADTVPDARLITLPDAGHLSTLDHPGAIAELLAEFLAADAPTYEGAS